jgi:hypothetical protein
MTQEIGLEDVPGMGQRLLVGQVQGRTVVETRAKDVA